MNTKRMIKSDVMFSNAAAGLSDKAYRLYINMMLFADDDGFVSSLINAKLVSGAGDIELAELVDSGLICKFDDDNVLVVDWLRHNNLSNKTYRNKAPAEYRNRIRVEVSGKYTLDDASEAMSIDDYRFINTGSRAKR